MASVERYVHTEQIGISDLNWIFLAPFPASPTVGFNPKFAHHALDAFAIAAEGASRMLMEP